MIPPRDAMQGSAKALQHRPALAGFLLEAFSPHSAVLASFARQSRLTTSQCCRIAPSEARQPPHGREILKVSPYSAALHRHSCIEVKPFG